MNGPPSETIKDEKKPLSFTEIFQQQFPYYISIGMTERQYWDKDCSLAAAFRKADKLKQERKNCEMWFEGAYIYQALIRAAPLFHDLVKKGTKAHPYLSEPFPITKEQSAHKEEQKAKQTYDEGKRFMEMFMVGFNKKFKKE